MTHRSIIIITIFFILNACSSINQFTVPSAENQLVIDGSLSDWDRSASLMEGREDINFYASFDDEYLYLFIDVRGPFKDRAIKQSGLIVYLSDDKDMRQKLGVGIPSGSFNLLREYPSQYSSFLKEGDWFSKPQNRELLSGLENDIYDRVMIVERRDGKSNPEYGFIDINQLEVDGMEVSIDRQGRFTAIEMKVPRDGSSIYGFSSDKVWLGFAVETPNFRIQDDNDITMMRQERRNNMYGNQRRQRAPTRTSLARSLGEFEVWYRVDISE